MQQKQNCGHPLRRKGSISRVSKVTCGLLFCLTTGVFAAGENVELLTSDRIENAVPDQVGKTVTIMVQDEMGPVAGANVVVKGTTNGRFAECTQQLDFSDFLYRLYNPGSEGQQPGNHPCEAG